MSSVAWLPDMSGDWGKVQDIESEVIDRDILFIELAYNSGLRREELAKLKVNDILSIRKLQ